MWIVYFNLMLLILHIFSRNLLHTVTQRPGDKSPAILQLQGGDGKTGKSYFGLSLSFPPILLLSELVTWSTQLWGDVKYRGVNGLFSEITVFSIVKFKCWSFSSLSLRPLSSFILLTCSHGFGVCMTSLLTVCFSPDLSLISELQTCLSNCLLGIFKRVSQKLFQKEEM